MNTWLQEKKEGMLKQLETELYHLEQSVARLVQKEDVDFVMLERRVNDRKEIIGRLHAVKNDMERRLNLL